MPELMDWEQLERYFAGELAADDAVQLRRWLMAHPEHAQMLDRVNQELDYASALGDLDRSDALVSWHTLTARMLGDARTPTVIDGLGTNVTYVENSRSALARQAQSSGDTLHRDVTNPTTNRVSLGSGVSMREKSAHPVLRGIGGLGTQPLRHTIQYAAITLVLTVLGVLIGWKGGVYRFREHLERSVATYTTTNGERANITLLDGTTVVLNVGSRLDVPADFAANHMVHLTGEALFTVSHHDGVPFAVQAGATTARVLGTGFVVRHYPTDTMTMVAVQEGKVAVASTVITAHRLLEVGKSGDLRLRAASPSQFTFATGVLTLDAMPLRDAIPELDRWYDADIRVSDPRLLQQQIRGTVSTASLSELAEMLEWTLNVRVVREGRVLTLYPTAR